VVVDEVRLRSLNGTPNPAAAKLAGYDCVVIGTDHSTYDYGRIVAHARLIVDTRNATALVDGADMSRVVKL